MVDFTYYFLILVVLFSNLHCALTAPSTFVKRQAEEDPESMDGDIFAVAQCRVSCLMSSKLNFSGNNFETLVELMEHDDPTTSMCWETCQLLIENWWTWHYMCDQYRLCLPGCQQACRFVIDIRHKFEQKKKFGKSDESLETKCSDTSNIVGFSRVKWTCDSQDSFQGCQIAWQFPLQSNIGEWCHLLPNKALVYVIFYNQDQEFSEDEHPDDEGYFIFKKQQFRAAAMTFSSSITLAVEDPSDVYQSSDITGRNGKDEPADARTEIGDIIRRHGFSIRIVAVSSRGVVANSQPLVIRSGTYGLSPPYYPPARLTPTVKLKNTDFGLSAQLSWRYSLPFITNTSGIANQNEILIVWYRHSCNVEPTFPKCGLVSRTWMMPIFPNTTKAGFFLPNLTYNSAYELHIAMAGGNSSRVLVTTPGCFTPDPTFRLCLPTTVPNSNNWLISRSLVLIISISAVAAVVIILSTIFGVYCYCRVKAKPEVENQTDQNEPVIPPQIRNTNTPALPDDSSDYMLNPLTGTYHAKSMGRDSAYGSVHQLSMMGVFRDQWEISDSQLIYQKIIRTSETVDWFRGVLGRETVWIKRLKSSSAEWRENFLNELAILKMLERQANIVNIVACVTSNPTSPPVIVLENFANSMSLNEYWKTVRRLFLKKKPNPGLQSVPSNAITPTEDSSDLISAPDLEALTLSLQSSTQLDFIRQLTAGMAHIHSHQFTHGCLEPFYNILVNIESRLIKITGISSSSTSVKLFSEEHPECFVECYMSPECLSGSPVRTKQADVWSFGVICWQLASIGAEPYMEIPREKLSSCLSSGFKLEQPAACSNKLYEMLLRCWESLPHRRPMFQDIMVDLHTLMNSNTLHIDFNKILSSVAPVQMITPLLPRPPGQLEVISDLTANDDDDSVFGGSGEQFSHSLEPEVKSPRVHIKTPTKQNSPLHSNYV